MQNLKLDFELSKFMDNLQMALLPKRTLWLWSEEEKQGKAQVLVIHRNKNKELLVHCSEAMLKVTMNSAAAKHYFH